MKIGKVSFNMETAHSLTQDEFNQIVKGNITTDKAVEWERFKKSAEKYKDREATSKTRKSARQEQVNPGTEGGNDLVQDQQQ